MKSHELSPIEKVADCIDYAAVFPLDNLFADCVQNSVGGAVISHGAMRDASIIKLLSIHFETVPGVEVQCVRLGMQKDLSEVQLQCLGYGTLKQLPAYA